MSVHIGELFTDVVPAGDLAPAAGGGADPEQGLELAREAERRARWLARRVTAEGFED